MVIKRRHRRRLLNLFAFALLAFAIYLVKFSKEDSPQPYKSGTTSTSTASAQH
jgi:hypothetical protein